MDGVAAETGEAFFDALVQHLARAMGTKCAWVTEWLEDSCRLRAHSLWVGDRHVSEYEYDVAATPCEPVIQKRELVHFPDRLVELFPDDPDLEPLGAVSYMGVPLLDTDGVILGHLAVMHDEPMPADSRKESIFQIFAGRSAAELRRLRRDRALREREEKLSRLIDSAMDAILELDRDLQVHRMNGAAERVFGIEATDVVGQSFGRFLTEESRSTIGGLMESLADRPDGEQGIWIPAGLRAVAADGSEFEAEATLSRFELRGRARFSLILRNVSDRMESERQLAELRVEASYLRSELQELQPFGEIIGASAPLQRVLDDVKRVAEGHTTVLITGETGTGKEVVARAIHTRSPRAEQPLVKVNCAAIPSNLQESELFGHVKGAFTGATSDRVGRFQRADGGTIFLDEVGELPAELQAKLLRVLQEGEVERVGSTETEKVDVRVIAATNRNLEEMVERGEFRSDLLYRLNVFPIELPPLRERGDDVLLLTDFFLEQLCRDRGCVPPRLAESDRVRLRRYDWPGNIRELRNVVERALIITEGDRLDLERALPASTGSPPPTIPDGESSARVLTADELRDLERDNLRRALEQTGWKVSGKEGAAELLGLKPNTLSSRMKALGIRRED